MPTFNSRSEALALIKEDEFFQALMIDSSAEYDQKIRAFRDRFWEHHSSSFTEEASGIAVFRTAKQPIPGYGDQWGTWLTVSKQYGASDTPYRVSAHEYAPWGVEVDIEHLADYADLGQAFDHAFSIHEQGKVVALHNLVLDEEMNRMVMGDAIIEAPERPELSESGRLVSEAAQTLPRRRQAIIAREQLHMEQQNEIYRLAWKSSIALVDVKPIIADLGVRISRADIELYSDSMLAAASAIQEQVFAGQGKLLTYRCADAEAMEIMGYSKFGTTFVVVERAPGEFTFVSPDCGVHDNADEAKQAVVDKLAAQYQSMREGEHTYWDEGQGALVELHLDELDIAEAKPYELDEETTRFLEDNDNEAFEPDGYAMIKLVKQSCANYRHALHQKIETDFRRREEPSVEAGF